MGNTILNIAAGKFLPIDLETFEPYFLVNVDTMYYGHVIPELVEGQHEQWIQLASKSYKVKKDIFEFMERTSLSFDRVCIYRYLEHVSMDKVLYFIYLLSTVTKIGSKIDIIVPNYETLARMILDEFPLDGNFERDNILLTTELLNEPSCPHASIWTPARADYFFELEKRFKIISLASGYPFDGRNIYMRFIAERL